MIDADNIPMPEEEIKQKWSEQAAAFGKIDGQPSPLANRAMHGQVCESCKEPFEKRDWKMDARFCSKACRKNRNKKSMSTGEVQEELAEKFNPLKTRAYHQPLGFLMDVVAIDWPANKVYGTLPTKNDYPVNFPLNECSIMTNIGGLTDQNGKDIFEADVASFQWENEDGTIGGKIIGTIGFDRDAGELYIVERTDAEEKKHFKINAENQSKVVVLGCAFTITGILTEKDEEKVNDEVKVKKVLELINE